MTDGMIRDRFRVVTRKRLLAAANGMPYRHESSKAEIIDWLLRYERDAAVELASEVAPCSA